MGIRRRLRRIAGIGAVWALAVFQAAGAGLSGRCLYCAVPGVRNYLEYGGHGLIVYDIDDDYRFVKRIPIGGVDENGRPINVKGVCASATTDRIYISTLRTMMCLDLRTEKLLWEKPYEGGCDRMAIAPDGSHIYLPSLEKHHWHVVDARGGAVIKCIDIHAGAHNTVYGLGGGHAYLAGLKSPFLRVTDTRTHSIVKEVGPFSHSIRPFTVNRAETLCYVNVNELLGFEIGDLKSGKKLHRVEVEGFKQGPVKRHGCPSHGVGLTPDESEVWVTDAWNRRMHIFDNTVMPPRQVTSVFLRDEPGWVTFRLDGKHAWPSTGDIVDVKSRKIVGGLTDEQGAVSWARRWWRSIGKTEMSCGRVISLVWGGRNDDANRRDELLRVRFQCVGRGL